MRDTFFMPDATRAELAWDEARSRTREGVRLYQQLLTLNGYPCADDGDFGPATLEQSKRFQSAKGTGITGRPGPKTWAAATDVFWRACRLPDRSEIVNLRTPGALVAAIARQHLRSKAQELPPNRGPWVRMYMFGNQGRSFPWCAGFASFVVAQAAAALEAAGFDGTLAFPRTAALMSCDRYVAAGKAAGLFVEGKDVREQRATVGPGDLFFIQKSSGDWIHAGVVTEAHHDHFSTIEGNTNAAGGREGLYVLARERGVPYALHTGVDFVRHGLPDLPPA